MKFLIMALMAIWIGIAPTFVMGQSPAPELQNGVISGKVQNESKIPFDLATVALFKAGDSTLMKSSFTENDGKFSFINLKAGTYELRISAMGYQTYRTAPLKLDKHQVTIVVPDVILLSASKDLKEVAIVGKKALIERKIDRTVVNVDALIANAGTSAMDVLEKSPGVMVDQNGVVSLKGKQGVTIFIDDKPTYLSGAELENYLKSLPASSINQIELMSNPPARYDAGGNAGVINIKTKKGGLRGFNGSLNLGYTQGRYARSNNSFNFNYRNNKLNIFGNLNNTLEHNYTDLDLYRRYYNADGSTKSYFEQNSYINRKGTGFNGKVGADYYLDEKQTIGVVVTGIHRTSPETTDNVSNLLNANRTLDSVVKAFTREKEIFKNIGFNLNYRRQFDKNGHELTMDADYLNYRTAHWQQISNTTYLPDQQLKSADMLNGNLPSDIRIYTAKVDYTRPLSGGWKLEAGAKTGYTKTDNIGIYSNTVNGVTLPDYEKSNHFIYKESINSGYVNMSREGKHLSVQLGLRLEHTYSDGHQMGNPVKPDSAFNRNYTSLFPTVYLTYKLDTAGKHQLGLNYGRRIDRPYFQQLNPFVSPLDKFTYYVGNPFLNPSFTHNIELSHTYNQKITTTFSYSDTRDDVNETIEILNGIYYSRPGNIGRKRVFSVSVSAGFDFNSWLSWQTYAEWISLNAKSDFYNGVLKSSGAFLFTNNTLQFKMEKGWNAELSGIYRTKINDAQFVIGNLYIINAGFQKKLSPASTLKMSINDIFKSRVINGKINNLTLADAGWQNRSDSRNVALSFSYRFGKTIAGQRKHNATGAEAEQNRVKN